jgi:hypothetical protein
MRVVIKTRSLWTGRTLFALFLGGILMPDRASAWNPVQQVYEAQKKIILNAQESIEGAAKKASESVESTSAAQEAAG